MIKRVTSIAIAVAVTLAMTVASCDTPDDDCDSMGTGHIELAGYKPRPVGGSSKSRRVPRHSTTRHYRHGHSHGHSHGHGWDSDDCDD